MKCPFPPFQIYKGKVTTIMQFGCFVQLEGLRGRHEGLVHISQVNMNSCVFFKCSLGFYTWLQCVMNWSIHWIFDFSVVAICLECLINQLIWAPSFLSSSQLRREGRVANVSDVVHRGERVRVKVLSMPGDKISLSIKVR